MINPELEQNEALKAALSKDVDSVAGALQMLHGQPMVYTLSLNPEYDSRGNGSSYLGSVLPIFREHPENIQQMGISLRAFIPSRLSLDTLLQDKLAEKLQVQREGVVDRYVYFNPQTHNDGDITASVHNIFRIPGYKRAHWHEITVGVTGGTFRATVITLNDKWRTNNRILDIPNNLRLGLPLWSQKPQQ